MALSKTQILDLIQGLTIFWNETEPKDDEVTLSVMHQIYMYAHIGTDVCLNKHEEWMREAELMYEALEERGFLPKRLE